RALALRPPAAGWRAETGPDEAGAAAGRMIMRRFAWLALLAGLLAGAPGLAVQPDEVLPDPALEARARNLSRELRGYELRFDGLEERQGPNYRELAGRFTVSRNGETIAVMEPAKRSFPARENATTEAALMTRGFSQLYLSLGDPGSDGAINVRLYHKPLVLLIWLGAVVMALGGALSLSDRRLRVGAPKPARMKRALQPAE
ncbi:MAG: hypothetical protein JF604_18350, partial [Bradyrhizobium sp.]|nr:hypothetical protein [Bradyrhizobium sp.]